MRNYVNFVYKCTGSEFNNTVLFDRFKQTKISSRWVQDTDVSESSEASKLIAQVAINRQDFDAFKIVLVDFAVVCWKSVLESLIGNHATYRFQSKLESIIASRKRDENNVDSSVIDLTQGDESVI
jgi:hypothetical protein